MRTAENLRVLLMGLPGSGKTVQGALLEKSCGVPHISIGNEVRKHLKTEDDLGQRIAEYFESSGHIWQPLDDELAVEVLRNSNIRDSWILDGFPRNLNQFMLYPVDPTLVVNLIIQEEVAIERVLGRNRLGDTQDKVEARLAIEADRLPKLILYLKQNFRYVEIDGTLPELHINQSIVKEISQ
jgi:adenylate kinase